MKAILIDNCNNCPHGTKHGVVKPYKGHEIQCELTLTPNFAVKVVGMADKVTEPPGWCPLQDMESFGCMNEEVIIEQGSYQFTVGDKTFQGSIPVWKVRQ